MKIKLQDKSLDEMLAGEVVFRYPSDKIWNPDGISLKNRGVEINNRVQDLLQPNKLERYMVDCDITLPTRCIDGRYVKGYNHNSVPKKLGSKIAGGTPHAALTHRIVDVGLISKNTRFEDDIKYVVNKYKEVGLGFGGHVDDHASGWNTGCGAVDNINLILEKVQLPEPQQEVRAFTKLILGEAYDGSTLMNEVIGRMLLLDAVKPSYMPKENNDPKGQFLYKKVVVKTLRELSDSAHEPVPELVGPHNEVGLVVNFVAGKTFDNDAFSYDNNHDIQLFGWDIWEVFEEAKRLYPYSQNQSPEQQYVALSNRNKHVHTRVALGVATAMVLTDGSLRLVTVS